MAEEVNDAGHTSQKPSRDSDQVSCHVARVVTARAEKKKVNILTEGATRREKLLETFVFFEDDSASSQTARPGSHVFLTV